MAYQGDELKVEQGLGESCLRMGAIITVITITTSTPIDRGLAACQAVWASRVT